MERIFVQTGWAGRCKRAMCLLSFVLVVPWFAVTACKSVGQGVGTDDVADPNSGSTAAPAASGSGSGSGNANATSSAGSAPISSGPVETVHLMGRFVADPLGQLFAWSGSQISAQFSGSAISIGLDELNAATSAGSNMYNVSIDNKPPTLLTAQAGGGTYLLASGLAAGSHTVMVQKRTEASIGTVRFRGFTVNDGQLTAKSANVTRRVLMIGDSITCGYGVLGTSSACGFTTPTEDATLTYGALAAMHVGADVQFTAWSGKGIYRNNDASTTETLVDLFNRVIPTDPTSFFDWATFVPEAIVINLGTNDFSATLGPPDAQAFTAAYQTMLSTLKMAYPNAYVFLVLGPMLVDNYPVGATYLTTARAYLQAIAAQANNKRVSVVELTSLTDAQKGCDSHPNAAAQAIMAQSLEAAFKQTLGW